MSKIRINIEESFENPCEVADNAVKEGDHIINIPLSFWMKEEGHNGLPIYYYQNELIEINGKKNFGNMVQTLIPILGINKENFFEFLTSHDGYQFLDPDADPDDFGKPITEKYNWTNTGSNLSKVQAEYANLKFPCCIPSRDYIVMNAHDFSNHRWFCKSIHLPDRLGQTSYRNDDGAIRSGSCVRMAYAVYYYIEEDTNTDNSCILRVIQWIDMQGWLTFNKIANNDYIKKLQERAKNISNNILINRT